MRIIQGQTIESESLQIDDTAFVDCTLIDCILEYSGHSVSFDKTTMHGCRYVFYGMAKRTVQFLQNTGLMPYDPAQWGDFTAVLN